MNKKPIRDEARSAAAIWWNGLSLAERIALNDSVVAQLCFADGYEIAVKVSAAKNVVKESVAEGIGQLIAEIRHFDALAEDIEMNEPARQDMRTQATLLRQELRRRISTRFTNHTHQ